MERRWENARPKHTDRHSSSTEITSFPKGREKKSSLEPGLAPSFSSVCWRQLINSRWLQVITHEALLHIPLRPNYRLWRDWWDESFAPKAWNFADTKRNALLVRHPTMIEKIPNYSWCSGKHYQSIEQPANQPLGRIFPFEIKSFWSSCPHSNYSKTPSHIVWILNISRPSNQTIQIVENSKFRRR